MNKTLFIVADYGTGDPAFAEVILRIRSSTPDVFIYPVSTPSFSTVTTGFWIYQLACFPNHKSCYIFSNTAPRLNASVQKNNTGEKLMYAKLKNGFELLAVHAGYVFSFVKPYIQEFKEVLVKNEGSQFRSRDNYPIIVSSLLKNDLSFLGKSVALDSIKNAPSSVIASIDGYGNIKTSIRQSCLQLSYGEKMKVTIGTYTHEAVYTNGVFNIEPGKLVIAPGSSGFDDPLLELFIRGESAHKLFQFPLVEAEVFVKK